MNIPATLFGVGTAQILAMPVLVELDVPATIIALATLVTALGGFIAVSRQVATVKKDVNTNFKAMSDRYDAGQLELKAAREDIKALQEARVQDVKERNPVMPVAAPAAPTLIGPTEPVKVQVVATEENPVIVQPVVPKDKAKA